VIRLGRDAYPLADNVAACPLERPETWQIP
jgi:hypothetical protein